MPLCVMSQQNGSAGGAGQQSFVSSGGDRDSWLEERVSMVQSAHKAARESEAAAAAANNNLTPYTMEDQEQWLESRLSKLWEAQQESLATKDSSAAKKGSVAGKRKSKSTRVRGKTSSSGSNSPMTPNSPLPPSSTAEPSSRGVPFGGGGTTQMAVIPQDVPASRDFGSPSVPPLFSRSFPSTASPRAHSLDLRGEEERTKPQQPNAISRDDFVRSVLPVAAELASVFSEGSEGDDDLSDDGDRIVMDQHQQQQIGEGSSLDPLFKMRLPNNALKGPPSPNIPHPSIRTAAFDTAGLLDEESANSLHDFMSHVTNQDNLGETILASPKRFPPPLNRKTDRSRATSDSVLVSYNKLANYHNSYTAQVPPFASSTEVRVHHPPGASSTLFRVRELNDSLESFSSSLSHTEQRDQMGEPLLAPPLRFPAPLNRTSDRSRATSDSALSCKNDFNRKNRPTKRKSYSDIEEPLSPIAVPEPEPIQYMRPNNACATNITGLTHCDIGQLDDSIQSLNSFISRMEAQQHHRQPHDQHQQNHGDTTTTGTSLAAALLRATPGNGMGVGPPPKQFPPPLSSKTDRFRATSDSVLLYNKTKRLKSFENLSKFAHDALLDWEDEEVSSLTDQQGTMNLANTSMF